MCLTTQLHSRRRSHWTAKEPPTAAMPPCEELSGDVTTRTSPVTKNCWSSTAHGDRHRSCHCFHVLVDAGSDVVSHALVSLTQDKWLPTNSASPLTKNMLSLSPRVEAAQLRNCSKGGPASFQPSETLHRQRGRRPSSHQDSKCSHCNKTKDPDKPTQLRRAHRSFLLLLFPLTTTLSVFVAARPR